MPLGRGAPSMADVAALAGVSHQTVSRVLNEPERVKPATRERVEEAIAELGYRRNLAARSLATQHTRLVGVLATSLDYHGPASTLAAVEDAARAAGYATLVGIVNGDHAEVAPLLDSFLARGVEGIVVIAPQDGILEVVQAARVGVPTVLVADGAEAGEGTRIVAVDQARGARLATEHLIASGCRSIVHVAGPLDWLDARGRVRGWGEALDAAGLPRPDLRYGDWSAERGAEIGRELALDPPDAVFCGNDLTALGVLAAFREAGVAVPGRTQVVGFDDVGGAAFFAPPLTTVRQPFADLGHRCLQALLSADPAPAPADRIEPRLILRASTLPHRP